MKSEAIVPSLRSAVASIDKDLPLLDIRTQNEQIEDTSKAGENLRLAHQRLSACLRWSSPASASTALWPTVSLGAPTRLACAWRWERSQAGCSA